MVFVVVAPGFVFIAFYQNIHDNYFMPRYKLITFFSLVLFLVGTSSIALAQSLTDPAAGSAISVPVNEEVVNSGDIVVLEEGGQYFKATEPYDSRMFGVVTSEPALALEDTLLENGKLVISSGEVFVHVSAVNGSIARGDFITSSAIPGVAQKADVSGQVLGIALQEFAPEDPNQITDILVQVDIRPNVMNDVKVNLIEAWRKGTQAPFLTPLTSLRYILAALITGGAFVVGFASFGKTSESGVEALGRNPLASQTIKRGIVFNMVLTGIIMLSGLVLAYLILVL